MHRSKSDALMSELGHERRFCDVCGTSALPPILTVTADILNRQLRANRRLSASIWQGADLGAACIRILSRGCIANIRIDAGKIHTSASLAISMRLRSSPQRYPENVPSFRMTRWHGIARAMALAAQAFATARTAFGSPMRAAKAA